MSKSTVCTCCGKDRKNLELQFYTSNSVSLKHRGRMTICKTCILDIFADFTKDNTTKEAVYKVCRLLDIYYEETLYESTLVEAEAKDSNVMGLYMKNVMSLKQHKGQTFADSAEFSNVGDIGNEETYENYKPSKETLRIFGINRSKEDLYRLETEYLDWTSRFRKEEITKSIEVLVKRICNLNLVIDKKDLKGEDTTKEVKTLQELMKSSNLTPSQDAGSVNDDTLGVMIKIRENTQPIPKPNPEWADVDGIRKYIEVWFLGHLCKMMGIKNRLSDLYEEELAKYEVDLDAIEEDGEDIE